MNELICNIDSSVSSDKYSNIENHLSHLDQRSSPKHALHENSYGFGETREKYSEWVSIPTVLANVELM